MGEQLAEIRPPTRILQAILASCRVERNVVHLPPGVRCTGQMKTIMESLGAYWDKRVEGFRFQAIPPEFIYEMLESLIDWDTLPRK